MRDPAAPMGLSSSALVVVFAVGLAALWVVTWFARRGVRHGAPPDPLPTLSTAELAYLHGGEYRLAEIELARLLSEGKLRISRPGMVVATRRETGLAGVLLDAAANRLGRAICSPWRSVRPRWNRWSGGCGPRG